MSVDAQSATHDLSPTIPRRTRLTYPFAEIGSHLVWTTVGSYLTLFYTDVAKIPPATAAAILLIARILDGVQDLGFGMIAERTMTRWGRFRPWIMFGAPFLALSMCATFWTPSAQPSVQAWYAAISYIVLCFVYTVVIMSYGSLPGVMTANPKDRLTLNWLRSLGGGIAQIAIAAITMPLLLHFSGTDGTYDARSFSVVMGLFAIISVPLFITTALNTREVIVPAPTQHKLPLRVTLRAIACNRPLMAIFFSLLLSLTGLFGRLGMLAFYVIYNIGSPTRVATVFTTFSVCSFVGVIVFTNIAQRIEKTTVLGCTLGVTALTMFLTYLMPHASFGVFLVLTGVLGLLGFSQPIYLSMVPDAVDYYDLTHGVRADGTSYAVTSLSTKIASAFGGALGLAIIGHYGYVGGKQTQTASALDGINVATNLVPALFFAAAIVPLFFFRLPHARMAKISQALQARNPARNSERSSAD